MRHGTPNRRSRNNRGPNNGGGQNNGQRRPSNDRNKIYDSNGPDVRIRGTAHQVCEKYLALAKDATSVGDIVLAESYLQHAEHYQRIINSWADEFQGFQRTPGFTPSDAQPVSDDLALPVSILGGEVKVEKQADVRVSNYQPDEMMETV